MTSSVEWLNGTPRADFAILTFARSTTAQLRKNKFSILVQWSYSSSLCLISYEFEFFRILMNSKSIDIS